MTVMPTISSFTSITKKLLVFWVGLLIAAIWSKWGILLFFALSITGAMPFILIVLWIGLADTGKKIRSWFEIWHLRTFALAVVFCYGMYGRKWSGDLINELFNLDARYFGITSAVLTVLFTPFGLLYRPHVMGSALDLFNITVALVIPFYLIYLSFAVPIQGWIKKISYLCFAVLAGAVLLSLGYNISKFFKPTVREFAVWADFNENHLCTDSWASEAKSVLFLDDGKVLGYFPRTADYQFKVIPCDYARQF